MTTIEEITVTGQTDGRYAEILTPEAIAFVVQLDREFGARRVQLLDRRRRRRATRTTSLDFLSSTASGVRISANRPSVVPVMVISSAIRTAPLRSSRTAPWWSCPG